MHQQATALTPLAAVSLVRLLGGQVPRFYPDDAKTAEAPLRHCANNFRQT